MFRNQRFCSFKIQGFSFIGQIDQGTEAALTLVLCDEIEKNITQSLE